MRTLIGIARLPTPGLFLFGAPAFAVVAAIDGVGGLMSLDAAIVVMLTVVVGASLATLTR